MAFDACKHFTTLDTAALIVVAIFRETRAGVGDAVLALSFFGLSLLVCAYGMISTALGGWKAVSLRDPRASRL